jgi:hypothetical protein
MAPTQVALVVNLEDLNGSIEAGIAAGVDPGLGEESKMPIVDITNHGTSKSVAYRWAYDKYPDIEGLRTLACAAVSVIFDCGLLVEADSAMRFTPVEEELRKKHAADEYVELYTSVVNLQRAATVIVATKATWWDRTTMSAKATVPWPAMPLK